MTGVLIAVAALALAGMVGLAVRRLNGRFTARAEHPVTRNPVLAELGVTPGAALTMLQFSSAFCAPCRATRVLCAELAARTPGVRHVEVDAESHLEAVRALDIWRTPTVLLVDSAGEIRRRASGLPTREQLRAAVAGIIGGPSDLGSASAAG